MANDDLQRFIEELRTRVSIADVVGAKVKLTKKGREHQGLCPFHNEKTPSFTVNEAKGFYHCFGCGAHGDIVKFEMEANGLPFMDALQKLAHQAGLEMPQFSKKDKEEAETKKSSYEIMEQACAFFERALKMPEGTEGLNYFVQKRGLSKDTIQKFRLGFAPNNNALMAHLKAQNIELNELKELGLIAIPEDTTRRPHDFFRNRVMIPITNKQGKIIAFGGRVMEKIEPKYLNSPDTPIFNKRRNLYNLDKARETAYKEKKLIICEGYMDVIALDSYGFPYAVAPLGTALTEEQIMEAWKVCPEPTLCLDGDMPGRKAAMRAVDRVLPILKPGYSLNFLFLPDNQDPDEYLKARGAENFAVLLKKTRPLIDILWQKYTEDEDASTPEKKALIEKTLLEETAKIADQTTRGYYLNEIKTRLYNTYKKPVWQTPDAEQTATFPAKQIIGQSNPPTYTQPKQTAKQVYTKKNFHHPIPHTFIVSPTKKTNNLDNKTDKNLRFIISAECLYPELIDDFDEKIFLDDYQNQELKNLQTTLSDIYHESPTPMSGEELLEALKNSPHATALSTLLELNMLKEQNPFINDLRQKIEELLSYAEYTKKCTSLDEEIKVKTRELITNYDEETYNRLQKIKQERDELQILLNKLTNNDS